MTDDNGDNRNHEAWLKNGQRTDAQRGDVSLLKIYACSVFCSQCICETVYTCLLFLSYHLGIKLVPLTSLADLLVTILLLLSSVSFSIWLSVLWHTLTRTILWIPNMASQLAHPGLEQFPFSWPAHTHYTLCCDLISSPLVRP